MFLQEKTGDTIDGICFFCDVFRQALTFPGDSLNTFWEIAEKFTTEDIVEATYTTENKRQDDSWPEKHTRVVRKVSETQINFGAENGLEWKGNTNFFCENCLETFSFDCPEKIRQHLETQKHKKKLPALFLDFVETFEFVDFKKLRRTKDSNNTVSISIRTNKTKARLLCSFNGFIGDTLEKGRFNRILKKCNASFHFLSMFICLCPICQVPGSSSSEKDIKKHRLLLQDRRSQLSEDIESAENVVCVIDFSSRIRSKRVHATQTEGLSYTQWSLFSVVVYWPSGRHYYDVFVLQEMERRVPQNSMFVQAALDKVFQSPGFNGTNDKNLVIWGDNGLSLKNSSNVYFLSTLARTKFSSVNLKFFVKYHGKSDCDRHFGCIARARYNYDKDITTTEDLLEVMKPLKNTTVFVLTEWMIPPPRKCIPAPGIGKLDFIVDIKRESSIVSFKATKLRVEELEKGVEKEVFTQCVDTERKLRAQREKRGKKEKRKKKTPPSILSEGE